MPSPVDRPALTRRRVLALGAGTALGAAVRPCRGAAAPVLKICQWPHFVTRFDDWFDKQFTRAWGERHGVEVVVDHVPVNDLRARAAAEAAARKGHDLFGFVDPPPAYEQHTIPLDDVVTECERKFGKLTQLVHKATYNPRARRYFALSDSWVPNPLHYRKDWWDEVGLKPDSWQKIREGARRIKEKRGAPAGFGLAPELDSNMVLRSLLWSHGASEQDAEGRVTINSRETVEAIKLMTAIFRESATPEVFTWDLSSNNRLFVSGRGSIIQNAISAIRTAEKQAPQVARHTALAPAAAGPRARLGCAHLLHCYVVWKFAEHVELAKRFLVDLVAAYDEAFMASEFYNFPSFPRSVPGLRARLAADAHHAAAYRVLADAETWSAQPGYPGYATAAVDEAFNAFVIPNMFARAARDEQTPGDAARQAEAEMKRIFARWEKRG